MVEEGKAAATLVAGHKGVVVAAVASQMEHQEESVVLAKMEGNQEGGTLEATAEGAMDVVRRGVEAMVMLEAVVMVEEHLEAEVV